MILSPPLNISQDCLLLWLQQQPTCPTCRVDLLPPKHHTPGSGIAWFMDTVLRAIAALAPGPTILTNPELDEGVREEGDAYGVLSCLAIGCLSSIGLHLDSCSLR